MKQNDQSSETTVASEQEKGMARHGHADEVVLLAGTTGLMIRQMMAKLVREFIPTWNWLHSMAKSHHQ